MPRHPVACPCRIAAKTNLPSVDANRPDSPHALQAFVNARIGLQVRSHRIDQGPLVVRRRFVAVDVGQSQLEQHGADVLVLELNRPLGSGGQPLPQQPVVLRLAVVLAEQVELQHVEVVGDQQADFLVGPDGGRLCLFVGLAFDLEPQPPQLVVGLARCFAAAEVGRQKHLAGQVPVGDPHDGLGGVTLALVDKFAAGGLAERILDPGIKVGQSLEYVFTGQTFGDRLGHGRMIPPAGAEVSKSLLTAARRRRYDGTSPFRRPAEEGAFPNGGQRCRELAVDYKEPEMRNPILLAVVLGACAVAVVADMETWPAPSRAAEETPSQLCVVWASGDPDVAQNACFMYTHNAKKRGWFGVVHLVVWGPSAKLLTENQELQAEIKAMQQSGVVVEACVACANNYGVADALKSIGIDVKPMGAPLSDRLKGPWKVLTF